MILICRNFLPFSVNTCMRKQTNAITHEQQLFSSAYSLNPDFGGKRASSTVTGHNTSRPAPELQQIDTSCMRAYAAAEPLQVRRIVIHSLARPQRLGLGDPYAYDASC